MDEFQKLTADERRRFNDLMAMRDADGRLLETADEAATNLLKRFVTQHGRLSPDISERLGGQPPHGRDDVLLDLVRALTGPHPQPQAWLEAQRNGGLNLFEPAFYRARGEKKEKSSIGSPGVFLQRMVAQYRDGVNSHRVSRPSNAALYTEAAMLTLVMVCRELRNAVCAKLALGCAWVIGFAVEPLKPKIKRQIDALASNRAYIDALGRAIEEVTTAYASAGLKERCTFDVEHSLPPGADVDAFFAGQDLRQLEATTDALVAAVEHRIQTGGKNASPAVNEAVGRLIQVSATLPPDSDALAARARAATQYMEGTTDASSADLTEHHQRLRFLMPDLTAERTRADRAARVLLTANVYILGDDLGSPRLLGDPAADALFKAIVDRVNRYAINVGPPPPGTPLEHISIFEAAANAAFATGYKFWSARPRWQEAGLLPADVQQLPNVVAPIMSLIDSGVAGLDVTAAHDLLG